MTHEEMIEVIAAHRDGKAIQYRPEYSELDWIDRNEPNTNFNFAGFNYRIKPERLTLKECWWRADSFAESLSLSLEHVLVEFIKLAKENGHV